MCTKHFFQNCSSNSFLWKLSQLHVQPIFYDDIEVKFLCMHIHAATAESNFCSSCARIGSQICIHKRLYINYVVHNNLNDVKQYWFTAQCSKGSKPHNDFGGNCLSVNKDYIFKIYWSDTRMFQIGYFHFLRLLCMYYSGNWNKYLSSEKYQNRIIIATA